VIRLRIGCRFPWFLLRLARRWQFLLYLF